MPSETIEIAYAAPVRFLAGRSRTPKRQFVPGSIAVDVPRLDPSATTPVASGWAAGNNPSYRFLVDVVASGGTAYAPFRADAVRIHDGPAETGVPTLPGFRERMARPGRNGFYLFGHDDPWPRNDDGTPLPPDVKAVLEDGRPAMEERVRAEVSGLALHGDRVYCDRIEPAWNFRGAGGMDVEAGVSPGNAIRGYAFRLDRRDIALAALERMTCKGGYRVLSGRIHPDEQGIEVHAPELLSFREDVHNARVAANHALGQLGLTLAWMPQDLIPRLHALAVARDGLAAGESEPDDVAGILREFEEARERIGGRLVQLKHVLEIGRDMIAMSLRSERTARIDAEDAAALDGFAPR